MSGHRIIRLPDVITKTGLGKTTIYQMENGGKFPKSVSLGAKAVGWIEAEVDRWIEARMRERQSAPDTSIV